MPPSDSPALYGIIDTARDERLLPAIRALAPDARCLFDDPVDPALAEAAPWVVPMAPGDRFMAWWRQHGIGQAWGIAATATADMPTFRRHLKKCLRAQLPGGSVVYFRFYDPRVLRVFLPTADAEQLRQIFGPIQTLFIESEDGHPVRSLRIGPDGTLTDTAPA